MSREELKREGTLDPETINHILEIVSVILRTGWKEAEIPATDLEDARGKRDRLRSVSWGAARDPNRRRQLITAWQAGLAPRRCRAEPTYRGI
jgi:hypothetical protein